MKYKILSEEIVFDEFFQIKKAQVSHDSFRLDEQINVTRLSFERGDSVAILIHETDTDKLLFTNQFRYSSVKEGDGWLMELTAGSIEQGELPYKCAKREIEEEIGYSVAHLDFISSFFVSPGGCSERVFLFSAKVTSSDKTQEGGGVKTENEDIDLVKIPRIQIEKLLTENIIRDAKTIIGLQWFLANQSK